MATYAVLPSTVMKTSDLLTAAKQALLEAAGDLAGAILYADAGAGELLQVPSVFANQT